MTNTTTKLTLVCYHYLKRDDAFARIWGHDWALFREHIAALQAEHTIITIDQVLDFLAGKTTLPERCVVVSFDDTLAEHARIIAPYLESVGARGLFNISPAVFHGQPLAPQVVHFATAYFGIRKFAALVREFYAAGEYGDVTALDFIDTEPDVMQLHKKIKRFLKYNVPDETERQLLNTLWHEALVPAVPDIHTKVYMSGEEVAGLAAAGHSIGLHTHTHVLVNDDTHTPELLATEIAAPKAELEALTGQSVRTFSYPYAYTTDVLYNEAAIADITDLGIELLCTIFDKDEASRFDPHFLGRYSSQSQDSAATLLTKLWHYEISHSHQ